MLFRLGFSLFLKEAILFGLTLFLGLYTAHYYSSYFVDYFVQSAVKFTSLDLAVLIAFFAMIFLISRYRRIAGLSFRFFLILVVFSGTQAVLGAFLSSPWDLITAAIFTLVFVRRQSVFIHNLGIVLGIAGIAAVFGLSISTRVGLLLLVVLSFYDIIAVYVTKHMVALARGMVRERAIFGFLIPFEFKGFFYDKNQARAGLGENFMILGSGDVGLPLIFVSSLVNTSLSSAIITAAFSLLGLFITHILFLNQARRRAMAALPPIATMTILGYLISLLV